jgi:hypothetical protein
MDFFSDDFVILRDKVKMSKIIINITLNNNDFSLPGPFFFKEKISSIK